MSNIQRLHISRGRTVESPEIIVVHGSGSSAEALGRLATALSQALLQRDIGAEISSLALAGYGSVARDGEAPIIDQHLEVLERACADRPCHIVGHSMGGFLALELARRSPTAVASLALIEPMALGVLDATFDADAIAADRELIGAFEAGLGTGDGIAHFVSACSGAPFGVLPRRAQAALIERERQLYEEARAVSRYAASLADYGQIRSKIALLCGSESLLPARRICERLESLSSVVAKHHIEGARHMDVVREPDRYAALVCDFIFSHGSDTSDTSGDGTGR